MSEFPVHRVEMAGLRLAWDHSRKLRRRHPDIPYMVWFDRVSTPYMMAKLARRIWARGHNIEGWTCPRVGYRLTHKVLVG
jgi:hypothetical protein